MTGPGAPLLVSKMADTNTGEVIRLQRLTMVIERSGLTAPERQMAREMLASVSHAILARRLSYASIGRLMDRMQELNEAEDPDNPHNPCPVKMSDDNLRAYFTEIRRTLEEASLPLQPVTKLPEDVNKAIGQVLNDPKVIEMIRHHQQTLDAKQTSVK